MRKDLIAGLVLIAFAFIAACWDAITVDVAKFDGIELWIIAGLALCFFTLVAVAVLNFGRFL